MVEKSRTSTSHERSNRTNPEGESAGEAFNREYRTGVNLMEQALENYQEALKAGLRIQEESAKWWTSMLNETTSPNTWQKASQSFSSIPVAQRRWLDDSMRILEQNSRRSLDLLKKAGDVATSLSPTEAQARLQELWENSLLLLRSNAEATAAANNRVVEAWMDLMRRNAEMASNGTH